MGRLRVVVLSAPKATLREDKMYVKKCETGIIELSYPQKTIELMFIISDEVIATYADIEVTDSYSFVRAIANHLNVVKVIEDKVETIDIDSGPYHFVLNFTPFIAFWTLLSVGYSSYNSQMELTEK